MIVLHVDVPKATYATSVSSKNSAGSGIGQSPTPTISGIVSAKSIVGSSSTYRPTARIRQRRQRSAKELVTLWLSTASSFRRQDDLGETLKAIQNAEEIDGANPDVWCQVSVTVKINKVRRYVSRQLINTCQSFSLACIVWPPSVHSRKL